MIGRRNLASSADNEKKRRSEEDDKRQSKFSSKTSSQIFNPKLIFSQIVAIQCFHYLMLGLTFQINHLIFGTSITVDRIFTDKFLTVWTWIGWIDSSAIVFSYFFGYVEKFSFWDYRCSNFFNYLYRSLLMALIVEKSKKCLDFSVTLFLIHLVSCVCYSGFPLKLDWWIIHVLGTIIMILFGEYLCSIRELQEIPLL
jgi:protein SYS1